MGKPLSRTKVLMEKNRLQLELDLQGKMIKGLKSQGWWADKSSDRFKAGKPDLRIAHCDFGQMDVELKYSLEDWRDSEEHDTGLKLLQQIKIKEMNKAGMPAVCLVFAEKHNEFFVTTFLRDTLMPESRRVIRQPAPVVISGPELFAIGMALLYDQGHHREPRNWRQAWESGR